MYISEWGWIVDKSKTNSMIFRQGFIIFSIILGCVLLWDAITFSIFTHDKTILPGGASVNLWSYIPLGVTAVGAAVYTLLYLGNTEGAGDRIGLGAVGAALHFAGLAFFLIGTINDLRATLITGLVLLLVGGLAVVIAAINRYRVSGNMSNIQGIASHANEFNVPYSLFSTNSKRN